jgi:NTE family protein
MFLSYAMFKNALLSEDALRETVENFVENIEISQTLIPFVATAVDLVSGKRVLLSKGSIIRAVMTSCAVPGFIPTISWDDMILGYGGIAGFIPTGETAAEVKLEEITKAVKLKFSDKVLEWPKRFFNSKPKSKITALKMNNDRQLNAG